MAVENITDRFQLPSSVNNVLPPELSGGFLADLDAAFRLDEKKQMEDLLGFQESRGLLKSGETNRKLVDEVLGPSLQRRREALTPIALEGAQINLRERQQKEAEERKFKRDLDYLERQATYQRELAILQAQLEGGLARDRRPTFGDTFQQSFAQGFGGQAGQGAAQGAGGGVTGGLKYLQGLL